MEVSDKMAGHHGKCPECGSLVTVPKQSQCELVFVEDGFFQSDHLNELFSDFLEKYGNRILKSKIDNLDDGDLLNLEIYTTDGRSQVVSLGYAKQTDIIFTQSIIGVPVGPDSGIAALEIMIRVGDLPIYPTYGLSIKPNGDGDYLYQLRRANRCKHVDEQTFYDLTIRLAEFADKIEQQVFNSDRH